MKLNQKPAGLAVKPSMLKLLDAADTRYVPPHVSAEMSMVPRLPVAVELTISVVLPT
jgi:hypothetical protein